MACLGKSMLSRYHAGSKISRENITRDRPRHSTRDTRILQKQGRTSHTKESNVLVAPRPLATISAQSRFRKFFLAGGVSATDFVAVRLDGLDGSERWRTIGAGGLADEMYADIYVGDAACAVAADGMGNVVIAGNTEGALFESTGKRVGGLIGC